MVMYSLSRPISDVPFVARESARGVVVGNKCGRDFLYYALHFLRPTESAVMVQSPCTLETRAMFGPPVPSWLAWTMIQFWRAPRYLRSIDLRWTINGVQIKSYWSLVRAIVTARLSYDDAMALVESRIQANQVVGIDISLGWGGLLDHVVFVYGYDAESLYVFDTHRVAALEYEPLIESYYFRLPKTIVKQRWTRFGRVWTLDDASAQ